MKALASNLHLPIPLFFPRFLVALILSLMLITLPEIGIAKAESTIYIRADGTVEGTDKIHRDGNVYTFTGNINDPVVVERDNIVVDGGGYTLQGTGTGRGIDLSERKNVTVKNFEIKQFGIGVHICADSEEGNNTISGNTITNNEKGIWLSSSSNNTISENTITNNNRGIEIRGGYPIYSLNNTIYGNYIANNENGIFLVDTSNNIFRNNKMVANERNFVDHADIFMRAHINDVDATNTVNGKPIYYWVNEHDKIIPSDAGYVALLNCVNITVQNLELANEHYGILLGSTANSTIVNNTIKNNDYGVLISTSHNNTVSGNFIINNEHGIFLTGGMTLGANRNMISGNYIVNNRWEGIHLYGSSNQIIGNYIANKINGNYVANSRIGIYIYSAPFAAASSNNLIYHNRIVNNFNPIFMEKGFAIPDPINIWDNGAEGNYWGNYYYVVDNNGDGIGDSPIVFDANNQDNYPLVSSLMSPLYVFDAGTWEWTQYNVYVFSNSTASDFSFNPETGSSIQFSVEGENGTTGFCNVTLPKDMVNAEGNWVVLVDGISVTPIVNEDASNTYLYFTYNHITKTVKIIGTTAIPEFPSWIILPLLLVATVLIILCKKRLPKNPSNQQKSFILGY